ncbi:MAG TPA: DUF2505 domain-containing protein [Minicystis sp.]|nr:DUF2505 domain-containing protein [Minicystis sp.]
MATITLKHEIDCDETRFWKLFFDKEFNERLYREALGFPHFEVLETRETDAGVERRASGQPKMNMNAAVEKVLGKNFRYTEEGKFDRAAKRYAWKMIPSVLPGKIIQDGSVKTEPIGEGKVRRVVELVIEAKVFAVGGLIESMAEKQLRDGWNASARFMNDWLKSHP